MTLVRDATYVRLRNIWVAVLGADDVQPDDDFVALGGDSLTALATAVAVAKEFGLQDDEPDIATEALLLFGDTRTLARHATHVNGRLRSRAKGTPSQ